MSEMYTAIDLGTTNSVIAYANIVRDKMKPVVLNLERKNDTGSTSRAPLLPSVVFYYKNQEGKIVTDVGDYAKSRYGTRAGYVCKSVKSLMGVSDQVNLADEIPDKIPADVSARILSYMINVAKKRLFQEEIRDVVITVPASFDSDQCQATIDAARKAGINVENMHEILLYEPKAVIYDFMRMQEDGEIPSDLLSLETEKNVMVFDLGGGTLDVTLHRVSSTPEGLIDIRDLAISRYTLLGGDNFDELLAEDMLKRFQEMYEIVVPTKRREEVMCKLRKLAEELKVKISMAYDDADMSGVQLPDDYSEEVMDINLYDAYSFETTYTKAEMESILAPLMGYAYKMEDVGRIQKMDERDVNNIIYPILDVLDKVGKGVKIDAVILNGGMTKCYLIRQRLKEFFGFEPLTTSDPDLAVARGAVYYHYCLHKYHVQRIGAENNGNQTLTATAELVGNPMQENRETNTPVFHTGTILNDSINLGLRNEYVSLLIPAGTQLPYRSEEIRDCYKLDKTTDAIGIELYLGRGTTKNLPNRRIATRVVKFQNPYPANTPISFQIYINSMRMMTMEAWITDRPKTKTIMEMDMASLKTTAKSARGISAIGKMKLNAKSEINGLKLLAEKNERLGFKLNGEVKKALEAIGQASNPEDFFEPCMDLINSCNQADLMVGYVYAIGILLRDGWSESQKRTILQRAKQHFNPYATAIRQSSYVLRNALEMIASMDPNFVDFYVEYMTKMPGEAEYQKLAIFQFVLRYEKDDAKIANFFEHFFRMADMNKWVANLMIQRYGRGTEKENQQKFAKFVKNLSAGLRTKERELVQDYAVLVIAELCSRNGENPLQNDKYTVKPVWQAVKTYLAGDERTDFVSAVEKIWNDEELNEKEIQATGAIFKAG